jgi:hypothetical protein
MEQLNERGGPVIGWAWEGATDGSAGCGVSDDEDRAREAAEAWLQANPQGTAVLGVARLSAYWGKVVGARRSRRLGDGRIVWAWIAGPQRGTDG